MTIDAVDVVAFVAAIGVVAGFHTYRIHRGRMQTSVKLAQLDERLTAAMASAEESRRRWEARDRSGEFSIIEKLPVEQLAARIGMERAVYHLHLLMQAHFAMEKVSLEFQRRGFRIVEMDLLTNRDDSQGVLQVTFDRLPKRAVGKEPASGKVTGLPASSG